MAAKPIAIGPFAGIDNVHSPDAATFQIIGELEKRRMALVAATDVDLDDDGWPSSRVLETTVLSLINGQMGISFGGYILFQDMGRLTRFDPETNISLGLIDGLADVISTCQHAGQLFWTDGLKVGRINSAAQPLNWGCAICPTPTLTAATGSLPAGEYLVAAEFKDTQGVVHASDEAASGVLAATGGITVSISSFDPLATHVRLYLAGPNSDVLYMLRDVPVAQFPYTITDLPTEDTACWTIGLAPPEPCNFVFAYGDRLMLVDGQWVYPSVGAAHHLYDLGTTAFARPETILAGGGLPDGFWTVSAKGAYWTSGDQVEAWRVVDQKQVCEFCAGSMQINTAALRGLGLQGGSPAVLFWCEWGLAVGLSQGQMLFPMRDSYNMAVTDKQARFAYRQADDLKQLLVVVE